VPNGAAAGGLPASSTRIAEVAAVPAGSGLGALTGSGSGVAPLAGMHGERAAGAGGAVAIGDPKAQGLVVTLVLVMICGVATAMVFST
jgi:hypothetical protein